jgi:hypothetical protein
MAMLVMAGVAVLPGFCAMGVSAGEGITKPVLLRSLGYGNSLAVVRIIEKRMTDTEPRRGLFVVRAQVLRLLVPGDLSMRDLSQGLVFLAGKPYVDRLEKGGIHALFLDRDGPRSMSWAFRDNVVKFTSATDPGIDVLAKEAQTTYQETAIRRFREARVSTSPSLPSLPKDVIQACELFRTSRGNRVAWGRRIWKSPLGAERRVDRSHPEGSAMRFTTTKPRVAIDRSQALRLLGQPTFKHGFMYTWECGVDAKGSEVRALIPYGFNDSMKTRTYCGSLGIAFDPDGSGHGAIYDVYVPGRMDAQDGVLLSGTQTRGAGGPKTPATTGGVMSSARARILLGSGLGLLALLGAFFVLRTRRAR